MNKGEYEDEDDNWFADGMASLGKGLFVLAMVGVFAFMRHFM